nr:hypothetical protein Iba_chr15fCG5860 [Ipomoea batatas]
MEMKSGEPYSLKHQQKHSKNQKSSLSSEYLRRQEGPRGDWSCGPSRRTGRLVSGDWSGDDSTSSTASQQAKRRGLELLLAGIGIPVRGVQGSGPDSTCDL